ncbi:MAG TPA: peptidoglycan recognition family protein [Planctomycetota bacterium]|nr:peptidoglycan recognition family protein [Planctomycetota bacterium]
MRRLLILSLLLFGAPLLADDKKVEKPKCDFQESPNFTKDDRGKGKINYIIIHTTEGSQKSAVSWFKNTKSQVSAHYVIGFDGSIVQCVKDKDRAWHAGVKLYNEEGIGIEHEGHANKNEWTEKQFRASADLTRWLCQEYGIKIDREHIKGHCEIAPGRKEDPGPYFKWDLYLSLVKDPKTKIDLTAETKDTKKDSTGGK